MPVCLPQDVEHKMSRMMGHLVPPPTLLLHPKVLDQRSIASGHYSRGKPVWQVEMRPMICLYFSREYHFSHFEVLCDRIRVSFGWEFHR